MKNNFRPRTSRAGLVRWWRVLVTRPGKRQDLRVAYVADEGQARAIASDLNRRWLAADRAAGRRPQLLPLAYVAPQYD